MNTITATDEWAKNRADTLFNSLNEEQCRSINVYQEYEDEGLDVCAWLNMRISSWLCSLPLR